MASRFTSVEQLICVLDNNSKHSSCYCEAMRAYGNTYSIFQSQYNIVNIPCIVTVNMSFMSFQLEQQLERLHSEDTPHHHTPHQYYWAVHVGSQVKTRQSHSYKFKEFSRTSNFLNFEETLQATQQRKLLDKMCKYKMDLASIVENTEQTVFCPQINRLTGWARWNQYTPPSTSLSWGIIMIWGLPL